ncbi:hypothetical protein ASG56_19375 [Rhodococcus sp. Leaf7]|nr:hypothetical protein ASG56_19375 [Rhodococcus sp. Leaf7]KQU38780.1 hypothetical protein ASG64_16860 [Rhodococcus sp. Leaf247]
MVGATVLVSAACSTGGQSQPRPTDHVDRVMAEQTAAATEDAVTTRRVTVSVIGDSFSAGSMNDVVWPDILAEEHDFAVTNASLGGAGYVAGDDYLGTFADQVPLATDGEPSVILVVGSENDADADPSDVLSNAGDLYAELQERSPGSRIVVIGPIWSGGDVSDAMFDVDAAVETAALTAGLDYVDTLDAGWLADPTIIQDDGDHPTDEGQYLLAGYIDDAVLGVDPDLLG